jgi:hypothetical protein
MWGGAETGSAPRKTLMRVGVAFGAVLGRLLVMRFGVHVMAIRDMRVGMRHVSHPPTTGT